MGARPDFFEESAFRLHFFSDPAYLRRMQEPLPLAIFAYGSLIFKPPSHVRAQVRGVVPGYQRRICVRSTDHRGVVGAPGRVANLVKSAGSECGGLLFLIEKGKEEEVLAELDIREAGGYLRQSVPFVSKDRTQKISQEVITYLVPEDAEEFVATEELEQLAEVIRTAEGPSGTNSAYLLNLVEALFELNFVDEQLIELANLVVDPDALFLSDDESHKSEKIES